MIKHRQSTRSFLPDPIDLTIVQRILEAGRHAPSGANQQPWRFVVVTDSSAKHKIRLACEQAESKLHASPPEPLGSWMQEHGVTQSKAFLDEAPVLIAVFFDPKAPYAIPSVWLSIAFMFLQIEEEGLSSLPYTPAGADIHPILSVPQSMGLAAVLPLGRGTPGPRKPRRPLHEIASLHSFRQAFPVAENTPD